MKSRIVKKTWFRVLLCVLTVVLAVACYVFFKPIDGETYHHLTMPVETTEPILLSTEEVELCGLAVLYSKYYDKGVTVEAVTLKDPENVDWDVIDLDEFLEAIIAESDRRLTGRSAQMNMIAETDHTMAFEETAWDNTGEKVQLTHWGVFSAPASNRFLSYRLNALNGGVRCYIRARYPECMQLNYRYSTSGGGPGKKCFIEHTDIGDVRWATWQSGGYYGAFLLTASLHDIMVRGKLPSLGVKIETSVTGAFRPNNGGAVLVHMISADSSISVGGLTL